MNINNLPLTIFFIGFWGFVSVSAESIAVAFFCSAILSILDFALSNVPSSVSVGIFTSLMIKFSSPLSAFEGSRFILLGSFPCQA